MTKTRPKKPESAARLQPLSLPTSVDDALRGAMQVPLPEDDKPKIRKSKKAPKKRKRARKK